MATFPKHKLTIKKAWALSLKLYRKVLSKTWYLALSIEIINNIPILLATFFKTLNTKINIAVSSTTILSLLILLITIYLSSLLLFRIYNISNNKNISWQNSLKHINKKYFKLIINTLIIASIALICAFISLIPSLIISNTFGTTIAHTVIIPILLIMLIPFCLLPICLTTPLILFDDQGAWSAVKESYKLLKNNRWHSLIFLLPIFIFSGITNSIPYLTSSKYTGFLTGINILAATILFYPMFYTLILVLFKNLKLRKMKKPLLSNS